MKGERIFIVGVLAGEDESQERVWIESERTPFLKRAKRLAREASKEFGTAIVSKGAPPGQPVALFRWGKEHRPS